RGFCLLAWARVAAIGLWLQRNRALQFATLVFVALGVFAVLLPITSVARSASLILAVGVGTAVARVARRLPDAWLVGARRTAFLLASVLAFGAIVVAGWRRVQERKRVCALSAAPGVVAPLFFWPVSWPSAPLSSPAGAGSRSEKGLQLCLSHRPVLPTSF